MRVWRKNIKDDESYKGFKYPHEGFVEALDWYSSEGCGGGLNAHSKDSWTYYDWVNKGNYVVIDVDVTAGFIDLGNKVKFKQGVVVYQGPSLDKVKELCGEGYVFHEDQQKAGNNSTQTAGWNSTQKAGNDSTQTAGGNSTQTAGWCSTQTAGWDSTQMAGDNSTQTAGWDSTQTAGAGSTQTAGDNSTIIFCTSDSHINKVHIGNNCIVFARSDEGKIKSWDNLKAGSYEIDNDLNIKEINGYTTNN